MRRAFFAATILAGVLGLAKPAAADTILFDFNGGEAGGAVLSIDQFDWWPGNAVLDESNNTILYQANLNINPSRTFCNGQADYNCITAVATLNVVATGPNSFSVTGGTFQMYAGTTYANDLTGGPAFSDETLILSSTVIAPFGSASLIPTGAIGTLDGFNGDSWGGIQTVIGSGGFANILTDVTFFEDDYFKTAPATVETTLSAGSNNLPFANVDPTALFFNGSPGVPGVGTVNGAPLNLGGTNRTMIESDASTTVQTVGAPIPEPATLTLFGLGLLASVAVRRRQLKKRQ